MKKQKKNLEICNPVHRNKDLTMDKEANGKGIKLVNTLVPANK